ncbi:hypothetical protein HAX54_016396 [Datura stramonium]|uniref:Uncharacterized protein n=1 Tax=Datura stramonium TaxID=4076 RepID=A0ABS8UIY2_DATST|nr:hypothetical protein [Datura stramonium]
MSSDYAIAQFRFLELLVLSPWSLVLQENINDVPLIRMFLHGHVSRGVPKDGQPVDYGVLGVTMYTSLWLSSPIISTTAYKALVERSESFLLACHPSGRRYFVTIRYVQSISKQSSIQCP